ncbi:MAG TPA: hypothetical protein VGI33_03115 [Paenibacillus sp.]
MPRTERKFGAAMRVRVKSSASKAMTPLSISRSIPRPYIRSRINSGVMVVPSLPGSREQNNSIMKLIRQELRDSIGQEAYDKRMKDANDWFESVTGQEVRS